MPETKPKQGDALRTPKPKKKLGLTVPPSLRLPHQDLIFTASEPPEQDAGNETMTSHTSHTTPPSQTSTPSQTSHTSPANPPPQDVPVAPQRDFTKVANSIGREAVPAGLFTGKSKQLYDCLYSMTRGAIVPVRTVRISRPKLMAKAHIGSRATFDVNIDRLASVGLIKVRKITGEHEGNEYQVYLPEEIDLTMPSQTSQSSLTSLTDTAQKLDRLVRLETSLTRHTSSSVESTTSDESKTSFKTKKKNDDDEAFARFAAAMTKAAKEVTGKEHGTGEAARWEELAELLITELKIAAGRTTVSSVPAFLTEHLRRRLWKKEKRQIETESAGVQQKPASKVEANDCPDCWGTGMYYPEGYERGVARCGHRRLYETEGKDEAGGTTGE